MFDVGIFAAPLGTADAALVSDNDNPAAPNTGRALLRRFSFEVCFAWDIVNSFHTPTDVPRQVGRFSELRQHAGTVPQEEVIRTRRMIIFGIF